MSIQQLNTRHSLKLIMAAKISLPWYCLCLQKTQFSPGLVSNRNTVFSFLLDRIGAAPCEVDILPCSERSAFQKDILIKEELCFLIKYIFKVKHVTVKREKNTHILDAKNSLIKITLFLSIWKFGVLLFKSDWAFFYMWQHSLSIFFLLRYDCTIVFS